MRLRTLVSVMAVLAFATGACRGDDNDGASARTTTTRRASTTTSEFVIDLLPTTTTTTSGGGATTTTGAPSAKPATTTTLRVTSTPEATVSDAPREAHTETTDNTGSLTYTATPTNSANPASHPANDPLDFTITCVVAGDGHGTCHLVLENHVTRTAQFPDGLHVTIRMQRAGTDPVDFPHVLAGVTSLRAGERAEVDATFDLADQGTYTYSAITTVAWP